MFAPAFLLVAASGPLIPRIRKSKIAGAFLDGVNVGSLALVAEVTWELGRASLIDAVTGGTGNCFRNSSVALAGKLGLAHLLVGLLAQAVHHGL